MTPREHAEALFDELWRAEAWDRYVEIDCRAVLEAAIRAAAAPLVAALRRVTQDHNADCPYQDGDGCADECECGVTDARAMLAAWDKEDA